MKSTESSRFWLAVTLWGMALGAFFGVYYDLTALLIMEYYNPYRLALTRGSYNIDDALVGMIVNAPFGIATGICVNAIATPQAAKCPFRRLRFLLLFIGPALAMPVVGNLICLVTGKWTMYFGLHVALPLWALILAWKMVTRKSQGGVPGTLLLWPRNSRFLADALCGTVVGATVGIYYDLMVLLIMRHYNPHHLDFTWGSHRIQDTLGSIVVNAAFGTVTGICVNTIETLQSGERPLRRGRFLLLFVGPALAIPVIGNLLCMGTGDWEMYYGGHIVLALGALALARLMVARKT